jgi:hypothetical protein
VEGTEVAVEELPQSDNVLVAKLSVCLIPQIGPWRPVTSSTD